MAKLIYSMLTSLDGYTEDARGRFGWGAPDDEEVHSYINELGSSIRTYLYGRRMYETMVYWESAPTSPDQPPALRDWARQWQSAQKIVFSRTLLEPRSARTHIEREFDPAAIRRLKAESTHDISVDGPELAAQAIAAGLVDEFQPIVCPVLVGGGKRFFPDGVGLDLALLEARSFSRGVVVMRYATRR
jgi:dihydrofolate reductase